MKTLKQLYEEYLYDREDMPQVDDIPEAVKKIKEMGIDVNKVRICANELKPSQNTLDMAKVEDIAKTIDKKNMTPIVISLDNHIVDGHHRWAGLKEAGMGNDNISVYQINLNRRLAIEKFKEVE